MHKRMDTLNALRHFGDITPLIWRKDKTKEIEVSIQQWFTIALESAQYGLSIHCSQEETTRFYVDA